MKLICFMITSYPSVPSTSADGIDAHIRKWGPLHAYGTSVHPVEAPNFPSKCFSA